jgi:hypothetical protein
VSYSDVCLTYEFQDQYYPRISPQTQIVEYDDNYDHDLDAVNGFYYDYDYNNHCGYIVGTDEYNWFAIGKTIFMMNDDNTISARYNIKTLDMLNWYNRFAYKNLFLTTDRSSASTSIIRLCRINNDHTVSEYIIPRAFSKSCSCSWTDTGSCKNGRFVICETDATSGIMVYDMEILANTTGTQLYKEYSSTDQQAILDDFFNGTINDSTGENMPNTSGEPGMWTSTTNFIELPETFDMNTQKIYIRVVGRGDDTMWYQDLWVKLYLYGETDEYLGYRYIKSNPSNYSNQTTDDGILSSIRKIKISLHCGNDNSQYWSEPYCVRPNKIESLTIAAHITTPVTDGVYHIPDAYHGICMKGVNKLIYTKHDDEYIKSWYIQDLEHLDVPPTKISLEDGQYGNTYYDGMGFSHYVYIRINDPSNIKSTWMYDLDAQQWTHLVDWNYTMSKAVTCGNDKCIVFSDSFSYYKYIVTADEPTVCRIISNNIKWGSTTMKYINNGKQLVLSSNVVTRYRDYDTSGVEVGYNYPRTYDLGLWLRDKAWVNGEPRLRFGDTSNYQQNDSYKAYNYPYKNGVITLQPKTTSQNGWKLYYYPIEYYLPHKTVGTTKTITAYNNPIRITGKGYKFTRTNDMSKLGLNNK